MPRPHLIPPRNLLETQLIVLARRYLSLSHLSSTERLDILQLILDIRGTPSVSAKACSRLLALNPPSDLVPTLRLIHSIMSVEPTTDPTPAPCDCRVGLDADCRCPSCGATP